MASNGNSNKVSKDCLHKSLKTKLNSSNDSVTEPSPDWEVTMMKNTLTPPSPRFLETEIARGKRLRRTEGRLAKKIGPKRSTPLKQISANPTHWAFFHPDQVGSVSLITNGQGLLIAQISHRPFGGIDQAHSVGSPEALKNWASYTGQEMDPETGLIYYQFRYYDPSLRRFLSPDNSTPKGPSVSQTYNRYAYVQNNPINFNDPTGHKGCGIVKFICDVANDVADGLKSAGKAVAETVKTVGATASAAVTASVQTAQAQIKNTPLVRSLDHRRAEVTHILGLDNFSLGLLSSGSGDGENKDRQYMFFNYNYKHIIDRADTGWTRTLESTLYNDQFWKAAAIVVFYYTVTTMVAACAIADGATGGAVSAVGMVSPMPGGCYGFAVWTASAAGIYTYKYGKKFHVRSEDPEYQQKQQNSDPYGDTADAMGSARQTYDDWKEIFKSI